MPRRLTTEGFIERAKAIHGDKYDYSKTVYKNAHADVIITCPIHGDFEQSPSNHLAGKGCKFCSGNVSNTTASFIEKAKKVHGDKYDYSKTVFTRNKDKVIITCPIHGDFEQEANSHLQGAGCKQCGVADRTGIHLPQRDAKKMETMRKRYGVSNPMLVKSIREKNMNNQIANDTYRKSNVEDCLYDILVKQFGKDDVIRQYKDDVRYPSHCDFYIVSRDMFVELNVYWTHGGHWFDVNSVRDNRRISDWSARSKAYDKAVKSWSVWDVAKRRSAIDHNLNYVVFWDHRLRDVHAWLDAGCPNAHDGLGQYTWNPLVTLKQHTALV